MKVKTCPNCGHRQSHENYVCEYCNYPEERGTPYPWCRDPALCAGKGYCPQDPNCGD